jgi:hypothetical protein
MILECRNCGASNSAKTNGAQCRYCRTYHLDSTEPFLVSITVRPPPDLQDEFLALRQFIVRNGHVVENPWYNPPRRAPPPPLPPNPGGKLVSR